MEKVIYVIATGYEWAEAGEWIGAYLSKAAALAAQVQEFEGHGYIFEVQVSARLSAFKQVS